MEKRLVYTMNVKKQALKAHPSHARTWVLATEPDPPDLARFLADRLHLSLRAARRLLDERRVFVNQRPVWMARHPLRKGDTVAVLLPAFAAPALPPIPSRLPLLWEGEGIGVVNKPAGLLSNGPDSVEHLLQLQRQCPTLRVAHRLDKDTTGCLLFAEDQDRFDVLVALFRTGRIEKTYQAIVRGRMDGEGTIARPLEGQRAITRFRVLDSGREASHLILRIETGRTHQIRKHLAMIGHPVLGDRQYGTFETAMTPTYIPPRPLLHAFRLEFPLRRKGTVQTIRVEAPYPADFREAMKVLRLR